MIRAMVKRKDGKVDTVIALSVEEYRPPKVKRWHGRKINGQRVQFAADFAVVDTETSHTDGVGWIYQWAVKFQGDYIPLVFVWIFT